MLNGYPGVGKLAIAHSMRDQYMSKHPDLSVRIIDYHLMSNLAHAVIPSGGGAIHWPCYVDTKVGFQRNSRPTLSRPESHLHYDRVFRPW